jgi:hypothetical protein
MLLTNSTFKKIKMKLLVIGNSKKLIEFIEDIFCIEKKLVIGWRSLQQDATKNILALNIEWDIILLCGYDYSGASKKYNDYYFANVDSVVNFLKSISTKNSRIIYINTKNSTKKYTFSRYSYAKMKLGVELINIFHKVDVLSFPTILESGKITVNGSFFSKTIFKFLKKFKLLSTVEINQSDIQNQKIYIKFKQKPELQKPVGLRFARPLIIDRALRLMIG